jgi:hypothetical protein
LIYIKDEGFLENTIETGGAWQVAPMSVLSPIADILRHGWVFQPT